jgi:hypothetical protein
MSTLLDLDAQQYSMKELKQQIYALCFFKILKTQKIDANFAMNYILNPDYQMTPEEEKITVQYVLEMQPHLKLTDLTYSYKKYDPDSPKFDKIAFENYY